MKVTVNENITVYELESRLSVLTWHSVEVPCIIQCSHNIGYQTFILELSSYLGPHTSSLMPN